VTAAAVPSGQDARRILVFAYACEPGSGSEPGAGWAWTRLISCLGETWVLTRENNREAIEEGRDGLLAPSPVHPVYVDLPAWARWWKRGQRGIRLYYLLWQLAALRTARRLQRERPFDLVWHVTLANAWIGSLAPLVGPPFVYGPMGGGVGMPRELLRGLGPHGVATELVRTLVRAAARYLNPLARLGWSRARLILVQNAETKEWLPKRHWARTVVFPNPVLEPIPGDHEPNGSQPLALFVGRLMPAKGVALAIRAIARGRDWRLAVCGAGADEPRLRALTRRLRAEDRVEFLGPRSRTDVFDLMRRADVLLNPSLREDGGWAVAEALACGLPVVCLDRGGPPLLVSSAGRATPATGGAERIVQELAEALERDRFPSRETVRARAEFLSFEPTLRRLTPILQRASLLPVAGTSKDGGP
jgi:glycosyltransferase involved in cell wall biosynthesis